MLAHGMLSISLLLADSSVTADEVEFSEIRLGAPPALGQLSFGLFDGFAEYLENETGASVDRAVSFPYDKFAALAAALTGCTGKSLCALSHGDPPLQRSAARKGRPFH